MADAALIRLFAVKIRLGFFDPRPTVPWALVRGEVVDTPAHRQLAKEAADQGLVLLKNSANTLPFSAEHVKKVAVIGRNANSTTNMLGDYFGTPSSIVSPLAGIAAHAAASFANGTDIATAVDAVNEADAVVLVVGLMSAGAPKGEHADEGEGNDRHSLLLPGNQHCLIGNVSAAAAADGKPVVVVALSGGAIDLSSEKANPDIGAILWAGYPGQSGGAAIADALFGVTSPSGRLTVTWYPETYTTRVGLKDMAMRPNSSGYPGRTHRFYTGPTVWPFGTGLSFLNVSVQPPHVVLQSGPTLRAALLARSAGGGRGVPAEVGQATVQMRNLGDQAGRATSP